MSTNLIRGAIATTGLLLACGAAMLSPVVSAQADNSGEVTAVAPWDVAQVGADGRSIDLVYAVSTNCATPGAQASVTETATSVTINLQQQTFPNRNCPAPLFLQGVATVHLNMPLAGRRILGPREGLPAQGLPRVAPVVLARHGKHWLPAMPRLVGLAPQDVLRAIKVAGLRSHFCSLGPATGLPRVVAQTPSPGRLIHKYDMVRVRLAGANVPAARCPGVAATTVGQPGPAQPFANYQPPIGPVLTPTAATAKAVAVANADGDAAPTVASVILATIGQEQLGAPAAAIPPSPGYTAYLATEVYVVTMNGHFTLNNAQLANGTAAPTGTFLQVLVDAHTGQIVATRLHP